MRVADAWALLGLAPTDDRREVKRAYGRLLKQIDVDSDPAAFIRLREALDLALDWGAHLPDWESDAPDDPWYEEEEQQDADEDGGPDKPPLPDLFGNGYPLFEMVRTGWQPERPPAGEPGLGAASQALETLLFGPEIPDPAAVAEAGEALFDEIGTAAVDEAVGIERWLLSSLAAAIPRSDPLIEPAMHRFGWDRAVRPRDYLFSMDLDTLMQRRDDRALLERCLRFANSERRAAEELMRPGRTRLGPFELGLAADVRRFLGNVVAAHPTIEHDLDPGALAWWRGYFRGRHLPDHFWLMLFTVPPAITFFAGLVVAANDWTAPVGVVTGFPIVLAATLAGLLLFADLRARTAAWREQRRWRGTDGGEAIPWLAAALLLPPAAAALAAGQWAAIACNAAALIVAAGAFLSTPPPVRELETSGTLGPASVPGVALLASATLLFVIPPAYLLQLGGPLAALCWVAYRGHEAAAIRLRRLPGRALAAAILAIGALAAAAIVSLFVFAPSLPPPLLLSLVPVAVAAQHLATSVVYLATGLLEWLIRVAALLFHFSLARALFDPWPDALVVSILLYALAYSAARALLAARQRLGTVVEAPLTF